MCNSSFAVCRKNSFLECGPVNLPRIQLWGAGGGGGGREPRTAQTLFWGEELSATSNKDKKSKIELPPVTQGYTARGS